MPRLAIYFIAATLGGSHGFVWSGTRTRRANSCLSSRLDAEDAEEMRKMFESGADLQSRPLTVEEEMALEDAQESVTTVFDHEDMQTIFHESVKAEGGASVVSKDTGSLNDMDDASFKMLMWKRLGQNDFDRIFKSPRVELEIK